MTKNEFLIALHDRLSGLPQDDVNTYLDDYSEIIDDRMEEGFSEEDAVAALGAVDAIAAQILLSVSAQQSAPSPAPAADTPPKRAMATWQLVLLIITSPIWLSLLLAVSITVFSLLIALWSIIIALFATAVAFAASGIGCLIAGVALVCAGFGMTGAMCIGIGMMLSGVMILFFLGCSAVGKSGVFAVKAVMRLIQNGMKRKGATA